MEITIIILAIAGAAGALTKDILVDNKLVLPKKSNGELYLGFIGGAIVGSITGVLVDNNPLTAFLAGYTGISTLENLILKNKITQPKESQTIEQMIRMIAKEEMIDPDLAVKVAKCESGLDPKAVNINKDGSRDRGLFQINSKWHPEVTDEQAFDPIFSTKFFAKALKQGNLKWWESTKNCWSK